MLEQQLRVTLAAEFVHFQPIDAAHPADPLGQGLHRHIEMDGIDDAADAGQAQGQLQVALADDAVIEVVKPDKMINSENEVVQLIGDLLTNPKTNDRLLVFSVERMENSRLPTCLRVNEFYYTHFTAIKD